MKYQALATDGDGTLLRGGKLGTRTARALRRWKAAGRRLILATGEPLAVYEFPHLKLFDRVVAENGAVLFDPSNGFWRILGKTRPPSLIRALRARAIEPLSWGKVVVSTQRRNKDHVQDVFSALRIRWHAIANRDDLMLLPEGTDKGSGVSAALRELGVTRGRAVGIGDAENDCALRVCGRLGAVANALPAIRTCADQVAQHGFGCGVVEIISALLRED